MRTETVHILRLMATDASGREHAIDEFRDDVISEDATGEEIVTKGESYCKTEDGQDVIKVKDSRYKVVATGLELVLKGPEFVRDVGIELFFQKLEEKAARSPVQEAEESQVSQGRSFVWIMRRAAEHTKYSHQTAMTGWDNLAVVLEAQFAKIGELLTSTFANERFRRIYFDFVPDTGRVLGIPCAGDITKRNDFPMTVEVRASFLSDLYDELPRSEDADKREGDDPVWLKALNANVALFRTALLKALTSPSSQAVLSRLRKAHKVDCYAQVWDSDTDIEKLPV
jgi:hypothetical protein